MSNSDLQRTGKRSTRHTQPALSQRLLRLGLAFALPLLALTLLGACVPNFGEPPRLSAPTADPTALSGGEDEPLILPAPTATGEPLTPDGAEASPQAVNPTITLWVNRSSPQYDAALRQMISSFNDAHNIHVELITIAPDLLPDLVRQAAVSDTTSLPDLVVFPLEYAVGWARRGILDPEAAQAVVEALGAETFNAEALELVTVGRAPAAIPSDGWQQLLIYRSDWFAEKGLQPPDSFERILTAADVISDRVNLIYSFNMPTESSLRATTLAFEQMAIANGCQIIDERGEIQILNPACRDALEFYRFLCNTYCPPGVQTEVSALNAYLAGRTGMFIASPGALSAIAGLDENYTPSCPECTERGYLAANTGIVTTLTGRAGGAAPQNLGEISYLGITSEANQEAAATFARYWFEEGYLTWLGVEPERKVPMRLGTAEDPTAYLDAWFELPFGATEAPLAQLYTAELAQTLAAGVVNTSRWGYSQGQGQLVTAIYEELTLSILLQELLSGYYNSERAAIEGYKRLVDLIPNYQFYVDPEPTPES